MFLNSKPLTNYYSHRLFCSSFIWNNTIDLYTLIVYLTTMPEQPGYVFSLIQTKSQTHLLLWILGWLHHTYIISLTITNPPPFMVTRLTMSILQYNSLKTYPLWVQEYICTWYWAGHTVLVPMLAPDGSSTFSQSPSWPAFVDQSMSPAVHPTCHANEIVMIPLHKGKKGL